MENSGLSTSRYCHLFENESVTALFHSLYISTVFLDSAEHKQLLDLIKSRRQFDAGHLSRNQLDVAERLLDIGMLISPCEDEDTLIAEARKRYTGNPEIQILYLILTETCNLACKYCFIENAMPQYRTLTSISSETAERAVDLFARSVFNHPDIKPSIIFYGGEPTINWSVLHPRWNTFNLK